jgi:NitT/TauT family transport system ATP-binding protein
VHASVSFADGAKHVTACHDVSLEVQPGQAVALIGPSGCGKSTMIRMAAGLLAPSEGEVLVNGEKVSRPRQATAFIPQDLGLLPWKNALDNAALGLTVRKVGKSEARARARDALAQVDLAGFERAFPKELSGGMRQRLAMARALAMDADLLLMDEPLSAIDALLRETLQDTLLDLWRRRRHTQVLVTHSIEEAVFLGQRIVVLSARPGTIVADLDNPGMGDSGWRDSQAFSRMCLEVRAALAGKSASDERERP